MEWSGPDGGLDVQRLRAREFPGLDAGIYLNAASAAPLPERARVAVDGWNARRARILELRDSDFGPPLQRSREAAARLVGCDADEIALGWNTSFGINLAALSLPVERGSTVVVSEREFPANVYPWMERERLRLEIVPADARGLPDEDRLLERLDRGDVSVFALSAVQYTNGFLTDLERFGGFCRERGIWFVVDAIQALGALPLDVRRIGADVLACGGHKWLCAPFGTGFAYVRRALTERMEPHVVGWSSMTGSQDYSRLLDYRYDPLPDARRFEVGTLPVQDFAGMAQSLELLLELGPARIAAHIRSVQHPLLDWLAARPEVELLSSAEPERRSGILAFRPPDPEADYRALRAAGVVCVLREGAIRLAPHVYNTVAEMERVVEILEGSEE